MTNKRQKLITPRIIWRKKNPQGFTYHVMRRGKNTLAREIVDLGDGKEEHNYDVEQEIIGLIEVEKNGVPWTGKLHRIDEVIRKLQKPHIDEVFFFSDRLTDEEVKKITRKMRSSKVSPGLKQ